MSFMRFEKRRQAIFPILFNLALILLISAEWEDGAIHFTQWLLPIPIFLVIGTIFENFVRRSR